MDEDEKIKQCEAKIENGEVDCQSNFMHDCCFISGTGSTIGGGGGEFLGGEDFFQDSFGKSQDFFDSIGGVGIVGILAVAFAVSRIRAN